MVNQIPSNPTMKEVESWFSGPPIDSYPTQQNIFNQSISQNPISKTSGQSKPLSPKVVSLYGTPNQSNIQNRIDNIIDQKFPSLFCPLTYEPFKYPMVDECGHTFEKAAIDEVYNNAIINGLPFTCPLNPSKVLDKKRIVENYSLKGVIPEIGCYVTQNVHEFDSLHQKMDNITGLLEKMDNRFDNVFNMSFLDRAISVFCPSHMMTVANKNKKNSFNTQNQTNQTTKFSKK